MKRRRYAVSCAYFADRLLPEISNLAQTSTGRNEDATLSRLIVCLQFSLSQYSTNGPYLQVPSRIQSVMELALNVYISLSLVFILRGSKSGFRA